MAGSDDYYPRLLDQRRLEGSTKGLSKISPDFYTSTQQFLGELREMLEKELHTNPTSKKVEFYRSQYQRAKAHARDIMDWRMSKVATLAVQAVVVGTEPENLLPEEQMLFDKSVQELTAFRERMTPYLESHHAAPPPPVPGNATASAPSPRAPEPAPLATPPPQVVVRVLADGLPFVVSEGDTVELHKEDVVLLPEKVGKILTEAKRVEPVQWS